MTSWEHQKQLDPVSLDNRYTNNRNRRAANAAANPPPAAKPPPAIEAGINLQTVSEEDAVIVHIVDSNEPSSR